MESRPQRRFFQGESAAALSTDHDRSGISLRSDQRGKSAEEFVLSALVDASRYWNAQKFQGLLSRFARVLISRKSEGPGVSAPARRRNDSGCSKSFAFFPGGRTRSLTFCRLQPDGGLQPKLLPAGQGCFISDHSWSACPLLVCPPRSARSCARFARARCAYAQYRAELARPSERRTTLGFRT